MSSLEGKNIVLGVTGGIAAYKACDLTSRLRKSGAQVFVIMTQNACKFVCPQTFETLSSNPVATDTFVREESWRVGHVSLAQRADMIVVAPATANIMAKMAHGIADDMLSTTLLAAAANPVLIAPAMNTAMWDHPATQENARILKGRGCLFVGPEGGFLACGDEGKGRMSEPEDIFDCIRRFFDARGDMSGLKVAVTAGPTRENVDPVRFISNRSSGKMGYAIAEAALERGAEVTLITGPTALKTPVGARIVRVETTEDLLDAVTDCCAGCDILIQSAAPADYTPVEKADQKIKKSDGEALEIVLRETPDVARAAGMMKMPGQVYVGFAAETQNGMDNARKKLKKKNLDLIALNDVSRKDAGFDVDDNCITMITGDDVVELPLMSKKAAAEKLVARVFDIWRKKNGK